MALDSEIVARLTDAAERIRPGINRRIAALDFSAQDLVDFANAILTLNEGGGGGGGGITGSPEFGSVDFEETVTDDPSNTQFFISVVSPSMGPDPFPVWAMDGQGGRFTPWTNSAGAIANWSAYVSLDFAYSPSRVAARLSDTGDYCEMWASTFHVVAPDGTDQGYIWSDAGIMRISPVVDLAFFNDGRLSMAINGAIHTLAKANAAGKTPLASKGASAQTADLYQNLNDSDVLLSGWDASGRLRYASALTASTVGAAGGASALPATPDGYLLINVNGVQKKLAFYAT